MAPTTEPHVHVPGVAGHDEEALAVAFDAGLARTTDLGVVAHPDDLELLALPGIVACRDDPERSFAGIVCTDGAGSVRVGGTVEELVALRWSEQRTAADLGRYGCVIGLGHESLSLRAAPGHALLVDQLHDLVERARPANVYTHNPADMHVTHVAVVAAVVQAIRRMPWGTKPHRLVGVEAWRDLDWLPDGEKVRLDVTGHAELADGLIGAFGSQLEAKRYDLAARGRRVANATLAEPRSADDAEEVIVAMDLSPLIHNDELDPVGFVLSAVDRFRTEVDRTWSAFW